jgi:hypothetical protein
LQEPVVFVSERLLLVQIVAFVGRGPELGFSGCLIKHGPVRLRYLWHLLLLDKVFDEVGEIEVLIVELGLQICNHQLVDDVAFQALQKSVQLKMRKQGV